MPANHSASPPCVGIIANPISARDIRRIVTNASNIQTAERVNIVLRVLSTLASTGVEQVMMMPDRGGISATLIRTLKREQKLGSRFPEVRFVDMDVTSTVNDTFVAARAMQEAGVKAIVVLGGDGTHRAVVRELVEGVARGLPPVPIAGLSTGTNNAFPEMREPTITALAVSLYATGRLSAADALAPNKVLEVSINNGERRDIAIVDAVISTDRFIGARALWKPGSLRALYLTFADPEAIGFSAIGGLLQPVTRTESGGLAIELVDEHATPNLRLQAPIAPGLISDININHWQTMSADQQFEVTLSAGVVALDGERELTFDWHEHVGITLRENAFPTVDIRRCMHTAATQRLFHHISLSQ